MAEEKTNGDEIYGGADGALGHAEKSSKARREFIEKAMEPAEKAKKELIKDTATDDVRLQGTEETKAPKELKPYVEKVNVVDRKALGALIEKAKSEGRRWKVSKCVKEGYRYTFTSSGAMPLNEKKGEPKLDVESTPSEELPFEPEPSEEPAPDTEAEPERVLTAMDVIRSLVDISVTDDGRLSICAKPEAEPMEGEEPVCIITRPVTDEEKSALGILPGDGAGVVSDEASSAEKALRTEKFGKHPDDLDEASSAEKRAYRNGGEDAEDLIYGRTIGRIKNRLARNTLAGMYKNGGEDREAAKDALKGPAEKAASDFEGKEGKMQAKGYREEDGYNMDDIKSPIEPKPSRRCPKCGKVDLNDAGECPLCDLGDESVLDDANESLTRGIPDGKVAVVVDYGDCNRDYCDADGCLHDEMIVDDSEDSISKAVTSMKRRILADVDEHPDAYKGVCGCDFGVRREGDDSIDYVDVLDISVNEPSISEGAKKPLGGDRFVKTMNSPVDSVDYLAELEKRGVKASAADDGVMVPADDYDFALDILMELEEAEYSHEGEDRNESCFGGECKSDKPLNEDSPVPSDVEVRLDDLDSFRPVAGARETWDAIAKAGKTKELAGVLADFAKDGKMTTTDLNDMLWFERDWVLSRLGINGIKPDDEIIDAEAEEI